MVVEWDTRSVFSNPRRFVSPLADSRSDFTARVELTGLPVDQAIFYRVHFEDAQSGIASEPWFGHLRSVPQQRRDIRFVWSGDTVGQGFGINPDIGGMRIYEAMRLRLPDFLSTAATPSTPTAQSPRRSPPKAGASGATSPPKPRARLPKPWMNIAAITATTFWMKTCAASMPRCRRSGSGTITR